MTHLPARSTDPTSSWDAAEHMVGTGKAAQQRAIAVSAVFKSPGCTSFELSRLCPLDRFQLARRLPECAEVQKGEPRTCLVTGRTAHTWWPSAPEQVAA